MSEPELGEVEVRPRGVIMMRAAVTLEVRYPERIIELLAVPYDSPTSVIDERTGGWVEESIAPGAFDGVERRANRVPIYLQHNEDRYVGRALSFHPKRPEGLVAEVRIGRGVERDQVLDDAADGILSPSIGFAPFPGFEEWSNNRAKRRITKAFLDHIALVPNPAYERAGVLAVRRHPAAAEAAPRVPTPNLDQIRAWRAEERYSAI